MKNVLTIIKKEFARLFKDRRMVLMIFLPGLLIFCLYTIIGTVTESMNPEFDPTYKPTAYFCEQPYNLPIEMQNAFDLKEYESVEKAKEEVASGNLDIVIVFPDNFLSEERKVTRPEVKIYYNSTNDYSSYGYAVAITFLNTLNAFTINSSQNEVYDLMDVDDFTSSLLAMLIPMLMFSLLASSCMSVAPEAIAGEKERGTMATMLITPVKRIEIVLGKIISLSCFAMLSGISSFLGVILSLPKLTGGVLNLGSVAYGVGDYFALFGIIISIVLVMISAFSVLSTLAKNVKESTAFIGPLMIIIILLGMCTMFIETPTVAMHLIPFVGSGLAMSSVLAMTASPLGIALAIISNLVLTALFVVLMSIMFKKESIMLKK